MEEENIYFGTYPQTEIKEDKIKKELEKELKGIPTEKDFAGWKNYDYSISSNKIPYMWYIDVTVDGEKYRGVYFSKYRPSYILAGSGVFSSLQDDNGYYINTIYWFKYEPIKWTILFETEEEKFLLSEYILDSQEYCSGIKTRIINGKQVYSNNYKHSSIRQWLNKEFFSVAFSEEEKEKIKNTIIENGKSSANICCDSNYWNNGINNYTCGECVDKVFLASVEEMTNPVFGFLAKATKDGTRQKKSTDYAKCQGVWVSSSMGFNSNGIWWLRSPMHNNGNRVRDVHRSGDIEKSNFVDYTKIGVVPSIKIN